MTALRVLATVLLATLPLAAAADPAVFIEDIIESVPVARGRAFLKRSGKCALWIGSSNVYSGERSLNPWVLCIFEGTLETGTLNEQSGCIAGLYGLHVNRYRETGVELVMKEGASCTSAVIAEMLKRPRVDALYPSLANQIASEAINGMGSVERDPKLEFGGKAELVSVARAILAARLRTSDRINWPYLCSEGGGDLLGLRMDCRDKTRDADDSERPKKKMKGRIRTAE